MDTAPITEGLVNSRREAHDLSEIKIMGASQVVAQIKKSVQKCASDANQETVRVAQIVLAFEAAGDGNLPRLS